MRNTILAISAISVLNSLALSQDTRPLPPTTIVGAGFARGTQDSIGKLRENAPKTNLFFCPSGKCLYYAGDCDTSNPNTNGLFDFDNPGVGISDAEVWVGVKPTKNATVTGASGNYATTAPNIGINPTPFAVRTGISSGNGGKLVCKTAGNAVYRYYGNCSIDIRCVNYYIRKLEKGCRLNRGKVYFVTMQPQYNDGSTVGYLQDDDGRHLNQRGWPEMFDDSYFNSSSFGYSYVPTWGSSGACGGIGCSGFSISLTGKQD